MSDGAKRKPAAMPEDLDDLDEVAKEHLIDQIVRKSKRELRRDPEGGPPRKVPLILGVCAARVWRLPTTHLRRVVVTIAALQSARSLFRFINGERKGFRSSQNSQNGILPVMWSGDLKVFRLINETSSEMAELALKELRMAMDQTIDNSLVEMPFGPKIVDFPALRPDLRFAANVSGSEHVPFGPEFPSFEPSEIPHDLIAQIKSDVAEMSSAGLKKLVYVKDEEDKAARLNMVELLVTSATLSKCVMCQWTREQGSFLEFLACASEDVLLSSPS